jgi:tRNA dimethylallyltransferase
VATLIKKYPNILSLNAFKAIGYQEIATGLLLSTPMIDIDKIKQRTRQYAKRQLTWIKHHYQDKDTYTYTQDNLNDIIECVRR